MEALTSLNRKTVWAFLFAFALFAPQVAGTHIVSADSNEGIRFSSGVYLISPINKTYNSNFLTLNLTFGWGLGIQCSLNYSIDGKYEGPIPLVFNNPTELHVVNLATGLVQLPELSEGSHRLTVYVEGDLYDYHGANPPGAPFKPTTPNGSDYVASWANTVYFAIDLGADTLDSTPPNISILSPENKTYNDAVPLNFTLNENVSQVTYSLDGHVNTTIAGNTTLTGLSTGSHNVTMYARDVAGNTGASETIYFTIAKESETQPELFPTTWIAAAAVSVVVAGVGLLAYFVKIKKAAKKTE
jgi:hypothetical protein